MITTVACPFINRGLKTHEVWLHNFQRVRMPRSEMKLLFLDMAKSDEVTALFKTYVAEHGSEWLSVDYIKDPPKKYPDVAESPDRNKDPEAFMLKRHTIAETAQIINKWRKDQGGGDMLFFEDDIVVPENAFERMLPELKDDVWAVAGVQCPRMKTWHAGQALLIWNMNEIGALINLPYKEEKETGTDYATSTATGFQLYSGDFLDVHNFPCSDHYGQDIFAGIAIRNNNKKLLVCWDMKFGHIEHLGTDKALIFRSKMCKTPVYDTDGTDLMLDHKLYYQAPAQFAGKTRVNIGKLSPHYVWKSIETKKVAVVSDLDGTICNLSKRMHYVQQTPKDWESFGNEIETDSVIEHIINEINAIPKDLLIFVTGRHERRREQTERWLEDKGIKYDFLYMAPEGDNRDASVVKSDIYEKHLKKFKIVKVFEDNQQCVGMWKSKGLDVKNCGNQELI